MADEFKITKEIMENADTYIPLAMKEYIASTMARTCIRETNLIAEDLPEEITDDEYGLMPVYCESTSIKSRLMMGILLAFYLKQRKEEQPLMLSAEDYDAWAGAHAINQIERFKAGEYREKAFDILTDYREMEKTLNSAIYGVLREQNDPIRRLMHSLGAMGSEDMLNSAIEAMKEANEGIQAEKERQERIIKGEEVNADEPTD